MLTVYKQVTFAPLEAYKYFLWNDTDTQTHWDNPDPQLTTHTDTQHGITRTPSQTHTCLSFVQDYPSEPVPEGNSNVDFTEARDSERKWHQLGHVQACTSLQTDNHASTQPLSFFLPPNQQHQSTEGNIPTHAYTHRDNPDQQNNQTQTNMDNPDPQLTTHTHRHTGLTQNHTLTTQR